MRSPKPITIVGGGLAGLTLGIGLRQRDVPVEIFEAGKYPRHRVCGEFISGRGQLSLAQIGIREKIISAGTHIAKTAQFFSGRLISAAKTLPEKAICISRFTLDNLLAEEFCKHGGKINFNSRWTGKFSDGIVRASGRRVQSKVNGWRFFGLKVHAQNVKLDADLEMHFVPNGYVGICQLADGEVNICGLFRSRTAIPDLSAHWRDWFRGAPNSTLQKRVAEARFDENSFCSVAGLSLEPQKASEQNECCIGDSLTMIPPVTGNGMSMAFESAGLALEPLVDYSAGKISWNETKNVIAHGCDETFSRRLKWARFLEMGLFRPELRHFSLLLASRFPGFWSACYSRTR
jgi:2-polyprenyl-6-methoxyphenol hydroxylase-like FAD-dependent oxidoreductase